MNLPPIRSLPGQTIADGAVPHHAAAGVGPALVARALGPVRDAAHKRVTGLAARARADGVAVVELAERVDAAGRGQAGVAGRSDHGAAHVGVARKAWQKERS